MSFTLSFERSAARAPGRLRAAVSRAARAVRSAAASAVSPHRAAVARLADIPLTVAGTGLIDFAAFHVGHGWGWLVTGISLVLVEHLIADEP